MADAEDVLIIGGGVIGVCSAYYLQQQGARVTLVEKQDICAGSSYGNSGLVVPSHSVPLTAPGVLGQGLRWMLDPVSPLYIKPRLDRELLRWLLRFRAACREAPMRRAIPTLLELQSGSLELYQGLAAREDLNFGFRRKGWLQIFKDESARKKGVKEAELLEEFGLHPEVLNADEVHALEPNLLPSVVGGVNYPEDAQLIPDRFVKQLASIVEHQGATLKTSTEVLGLETSGGRISTVVTTRGNYRPDHVVLAAGAWSPVLVRELGLRIPIQAAKGYSVTIKAPSTCPGRPLMLFEKKIAATPMGEMLRFGGTLELAGLDLTINRPRVDAITRSAREYLPGLDNMELIEIWRGLRPATPDGVPIIGRTRQLENLIVASGHGMIGMSLGPMTGKLVSQIVSDQQPVIDLTPLRLERFD